MTDAWLDTPEGEAILARVGWRSDAFARRCWCRDHRKPCSYHEGYEDATNQVLRALTEDAPCDTCGGTGRIDGTYDEPWDAPCPAGCDGGIRRAPLVPRGAATIDSLRDAFTRGITAGVGQERAAVSGALADAGDLPGNLSPSEAIRRLTEERDALRAALEPFAEYATMFDHQDPAPDRTVGVVMLSDLYAARRALLSAQKDDER